MIIGSLIVLAVFAAVWLWMRRRTHRLHNRIDTAMQICECEAALKRAETMNDSVEKVMQKIDSSAPTEENPPLPPAAGASTVKVIVSLAALMLAWFAGGEMREHTFRVQTFGGSVAAAAPGIVPNGRFDARLAELRTRPTIPAIDYFQRQPVDHGRRAEVAAALESIVNSPDIDRARVAVRALAKWGDKSNAEAVERFAGRERGTYRVLAQNALAKLQ